MQVFSRYRKKLLIGAILAAVIITSGIVASAFLILPKAFPQNGAAVAAESQIAVELTDPPVVPRGTTSLNLTYSEVDL